MAGPLDAPLRGLARTLIGQFGKTVIVRKRTSGDFDPSTNEVLNTPLEYDIKAQVVDVQAREVGGDVRLGDRRVTVAASDLDSAPQPESWEIEIDDLTYEVVHVKTIYANEDPVLHEMTVRR